MEQYYVDKVPQRSGAHQVHQKGCRCCVTRTSIYLGALPSFQEALRKARRYYVLVDRCAFCGDGGEGAR